MLLPLMTLMSSLTFDCPSAITTHQELVPPTHSGWEAVVRDNQGKPATKLENYLEGVSLFDGEPDELANLKPDNGDSQGEPAYWSQLDGAKLYLVCHYRGTAARLQKPLPAHLSSCQVNQKGPFDIKGIRCQQGSSRRTQ